MKRQTMHTTLKAAAAAALLATTALAAPAAVRASSSNSHVNMDTTDPRFGAVEAASQPDLADQLGVRWTRIPFIWSYVQPNGPQSWNPFVLDSHGSDGVINREIARGRNIVGILLGSPDWAAQYPAWHRASVPRNIFEPWSPPATDKAETTPTNAHTNYWGNYCYWLAKHYAGRIDQWIIWNEVSIPPRPDGKPGPWTQWFAGMSHADSVRNYARLLEVSYQAIHAANPNAKIVLYGDPYWYDKGRFVADVLTQLHKDDPTNAHQGYFDVANLHLYIGPASFYWIIGDLRRELSKFGWGNKEIWISETNVEPYDVPGHYVSPKLMGFRATTDEQSTFLTEAFAVYIAAKAARVEVYRLYDGHETAAGGPPMGMVDNSNVVRPIGHTFKFLVSLYRNATGGSFTTGELYPFPHVGGQAGVFKVVLNKPGQRITVLWNGLGAHSSYTAQRWTVGGITYDAHNNIVLPMRDPQGISYDRYATATYRLPVHTTANAVTVYDKFGNALVLHKGQTAEINNHNWDGSLRREAHRTTISWQGNTYIVQLRGGTTYTNPDDQRIPTEGGDPAIIVEPANGTDGTQTGSAKAPGASMPYTWVR